MKCDEIYKKINETQDKLIIELEKQFPIGLAIDVQKTGCIWRMVVSGHGFGRNAEYIKCKSRNGKIHDIYFKDIIY